MALVIQTNTASLQAQKNLGRNQAQLAQSFNRLSSGLRVNTAADDAAGLAISEGMKADIRSFTVAERNAGDAISMAQSAEGALGEVHSILGRMRELAMQSANGSLSSDDRGYLDTEYTALKDEITRIQGSAKFGETSLVDTATTQVGFQVGLGTAATDVITLDFGGLDLSTVLAGDVTDVTNSQTALDDIDEAIGLVSDKRASFGAAMNRMEITTANIQTMKLNLEAANSRIVDVDVASETARMSRNQVLTQAGVSVLAQANQLPQLAFGLIG